MLKIKNRTINVFLGIFLFALFLKKMAFVGGDLLLIITGIGLVIAFMIRSLINYSSLGISSSLRNLITISSLYFLLSVICIVFRHQWWYMPFWDIIINYLWILMTIIVLVMMILYKTKAKEIEKYISNHILILTIIIGSIASTSFYTSTEIFCKIYKNYSAEELYQRWDNNP